MAGLKTSSTTLSDDELEKFITINDRIVGMEILIIKIVIYSYTPQPSVFALLRRDFALNDNVGRGRLLL